MTEARTRVGRPSIFTSELADEILTRIACGDSLVTICREDGMPARGTVMRWVRERPEFRDSYRACAQERLESYAEQIVEIADDEEIDPNKAKVMIAARQWTMARLDPKKWGDKTTTEISGPGGGPVEITNEHRARALAAIIAAAQAERGRRKEPSDE